MMLDKRVRAHMVRLFVGASALSMSVYVAPVAAQTGAAAPNQEAPAAGDDKKDQDIVVTARKRDERLQDVPIAVTYFSGDALEKNGVRSFTDLAQSNPNVKITAVQGSPVVGTSVAIRGNLQGSGTIQVDASVGLYLDGHVISHTFGVAGVTVDIDSVQTLKGPQGTLFGRNTTGGAVLIQTKDPEIGRGFTGYVQAEGGELDTRRFGGAVNVPLGGEAALRIAYQNNYHGDFATYSNGVDAGRKRDETIRGKLLFKPFAGTSILLSAEHSSESGTGALNVAAQPNAPVYDNIPVTPSIGTALSVPTPGTTIPIDPRANNQFARAHSTLLGATVTQQLGAGQLKLLGAYHDYEVFWFQDLPPSFGYTQQFKPDNHDVSAELQYNTKLFGDIIDLTSGLYFFSETVHEDQNTFLYSGDSRTSRFLTQDSTSKSAYAQATLRVFEGLHLTGGLRYTSDIKEGTLLSSTIVSAPGTKPGSPGYVPVLAGDRAAASANPVARNRLTNDRLNYLVSADYKIAPDVLVYASTATGYRAGGTGVDRVLEPTFANYATIRTNPDYFRTNTFLPESIKNYEVGLKSQFFRKMLTINLAGFIQDYKDYQFSGIDPDTKSRVTGNTNAKIKGVEAEVTLRLPTGTTLAGSYGYTDARVHRPGTGFDGIPLPGISDTTYSGNVTQRFDVAGGDLDLVATYSWRSSYAQYIAEPNSYIRPLGLLNVSANYERGRYTLGVFANNATNEKYYGSIVYSAPVINLATLGMPRVIGGRVKVRF